MFEAGIEGAARVPVETTSPDTDDRRCREPEAVRVVARRACAGGLACWLALPATISASAPPLVAVHGIRRSARTQARAYAARAAALGRPVIAPLFDAKAWPRYQQVVRGRRADLALLALLEELRLAGVWRTPRVALAGYSGGAQFAHRFAMLYPHLVERLTVTAAGWYTFPDGSPFPYGLGARPGHRDDWGPRMAAGLDRFLSIPVAVCVGTADDSPDENTRRGPGVDRRQGADRRTRAERWTRALAGAAAARSLTPRARLFLLDGCGHDFTECVVRGGLAGIALPGSAEPATGAIASMPAPDAGRHGRAS